MLGHGTLGWCKVIRCHREQADSFVRKDKRPHGLGWEQNQADGDWSRLWFRFQLAFSHRFRVGLARWAGKGLSISRHPNAQVACVRGVSSVPSHHSSLLSAVFASLLQTMGSQTDLLQNLDFSFPGVKLV